MSALPLNEVKNAAVALLALVPQSAFAAGEGLGAVFAYIHIGANIATRAKDKSDAMQPLYDMIKVLVAAMEYDLVDDVNQGILILEKILDGEKTSVEEKTQLKEISAKLKAYKA